MGYRRSDRSGASSPFPPHRIGPHAPHPNPGDPSRCRRAPGDRGRQPHPADSGAGDRAVHRDAHADEGRHRLAALRRPPLAVRPGALCRCDRGEPAADRVDIGDPDPDLRLAGHRHATGRHSVFRRHGAGLRRLDRLAAAPLRLRVPASAAGVRRDRHGAAAGARGRSGPARAPAGRGRPALSGAVRPKAGRGAAAAGDLDRCRRACRPGLRAETPLRRRVPGAGGAGADPRHEALARHAARRGGNAGRLCGDRAS